jgi:CHAD domain-containing protein
MAVIIPLPAGPAPEHRGLVFWMQRVLRELERVREAPEPDAVHDLRVALRRCRSIAAAMKEVDPHPAWEEMRKAGRKLFRRLGALRDAQVQEDWVKKLGAESDKLRSVILSALESRERASREEALRVADRFDAKEWKSLGTALRGRARLVPPGGLAAQCLALERLAEARELHRLALRSERPKPWHKLRIGVKRFRYTTEGLLPEHYAAWSEDLKRVQDLLGDIHDLDVLRELVKEAAEEGLEIERAAWNETITRERTARIETYRQLTLGTVSLWNRWQLGLPSNGQMEAAGLARIQTTARAADTHLRRTLQDAKLARGILDAFRRAKIAAEFSDKWFRRTFVAAARLQGVRPDGAGKAGQKAARKFLAALPAPPGWTDEDWQIVAMAVRFHRGAEPRPDRGAMAKLSEDQKKRVCQIAGMLRLGRALRKVGISTPKGMRASQSAEATVLTVQDIPDSPDVSAKLAAAKHLLERGTGKPILLKSAPAQVKVMSAAAPVEQDLQETASAGQAI